MKGKKNNAYYAIPENLGKLDTLLLTIPISYRRIAKKAYAGEKKGVFLIKTKCQECVNYEDVRNRVKNCTAYRCPLHAWRPYQNQTKEK